MSTCDILCNSTWKIHHSQRDYIITRYHFTLSIWICAKWFLISDFRNRRHLNESWKLLIAVDPKFSAPVSNITVPVSRDAILVCKVHDLYQYKVSQIVEQLKVKTEIMTRERKKSRGEFW